MGGVWGCIGSEWMYVERESERDGQTDIGTHTHKERERERERINDIEHPSLLSLSSLFYLLVNE
jgi:hypothetical protein